MATDPYGMEIPIPPDGTKVHEFPKVARDGLNKVAQILSGALPASTEAAITASADAAVADSMASGAAKLAIIQGQASAAGVALTTNRVVFPYTVATTVYSRFNGTGGNTSLEIRYGAGVDGADAYAAIWTVATTAASGYVAYSNSAAPASPHLAVSAGQPFNASIYAKTSKNQYLTGRIDFYDAANTVMPSITGAATLTPAGINTRLSVAGTVPAGAVRARVIAATAPSQNGGLAWAVGDWLEVSRPQYTEGSRRLWPIFTGASPNGYWAGAVGGSESLAVFDKERVQTIAAAGAALALPDLYDLYDLTLTAASCALTLPAPAPGAGAAFTIRQDATGGRAITWPATIKWPGGIAPALSAAAGAVDNVAIISADGATWFGFFTGKGMA